MPPQSALSKAASELQVVGETGLASFTGWHATGLAGHSMGLLI
jgi:hypothetical protein